jgi:hypothetical protein
MRDLDMLKVVSHQAEGRRRTKVIPRFINERSGLGLVFAVLMDASASWHGIKITTAVCQDLGGSERTRGQNFYPIWLPEKSIKWAFLSIARFEGI